MQMMSFLNRRLLTATLKRINFGRLGADLERLVNHVFDHENLFLVFLDVLGGKILERVYDVLVILLLSQKA